jgi:hypothetical protein
MMKQINVGCKTSWGKSLGRRKLNWEDNIKMKLTVIGGGDFSCLDMNSMQSEDTPTAYLLNSCKW